MSEYLRAEADRKNSIINNTDDKIQFEHQIVSDVEAFEYGIYENSLDINPFGIPVYLNMQDNNGAGAFIRANEQTINNAANEFGIDSNY